MEADGGVNEDTESDEDEQVLVLWERDPLPSVKVKTYSSETPEC